MEYKKEIEFIASLYNRGIRIKSYEELEEEYNITLDKDIEEWSFFKGEKYFILAINENKDLLAFIKRNLKSLLEFDFSKFYMFKS